MEVGRQSASMAGAFTTTAPRGPTQHPVLEAAVGALCPREHSNTQRAALTSRESPRLRLWGPPHLVDMPRRSFPHPQTPSFFSLLSGFSVGCVTSESPAPVII